MMTEILSKPYPKNNTYLIYSDGRIFGMPKIGNHMKGRFLRFNINEDGYAKVKLYPEKKTVSVHRLVAETFIENPLDLPHVNHLDGNKENNSVDNLEWTTDEGNLLHANETGLINYHTRPRGILHGRATINENDVVNIRKRYVRRCFINGAAAIGRDYGLDKSTICDIIHRKIWQHVE